MNSLRDVQQVGQCTLLDPPESAGELSSASTRGCQFVADALRRLTVSGP